MAQDELTNQLVELYSLPLMEDEDEDSFALGYILAEGEDYYLFQGINEYGILDSIQLRLKDYVAQIETESEYLKMYEVFIAYNKKIGAFDPYQISQIETDQGAPSLNVILSECLQAQKLISVITSENELLITGKIILLDNQNMVISKVNFAELAQREKISIPKSTIIAIDLVSSENVLLEHYFKQ